MTTKSDYTFVLWIFVSFLILSCDAQNYCYVNAGEWCTNSVKKSQNGRRCTCASDLLCIKNKCQGRPENQNGSSTSFESVVNFDQPSVSEVIPEGSGFTPFECLLPLGAVCDKGLGKEISFYCKCLKGLKCKNNVCVVDDNAKHIGTKKQTNSTIAGLNAFHPDIRRKHCQIPSGSPCEIPRRSLKEICSCQPGHRCVNGLCTSYKNLGG